MAQEGSNSVAIVAIIILVLVALGAVYFFTNGFQFTKSETTIVQPAVQTGTSSTGSNSTNSNGQ